MQSAICFTIFVTRPDVRPTSARGEETRCIKEWKDVKEFLHFLVIRLQINIFSGRTLKQKELDEQDYMYFLPRTTYKLRHHISIDH